MFFPSRLSLCRGFAHGVVFALCAAAPAVAAAAPPPGPAAQAGTDVLTYHDDNFRTGLYPHETVLTPANVDASHFGLLHRVRLDGKVHGQPLYMAHVRVKGHLHDVVFAATEHDSVYALDAGSGKVLWKRSLLAHGERPSGPQGCGQVVPEIGVTSTPVIDPSRGAQGTLYVVAMSKDRAGHYRQRLHALAVGTGHERPGSPRAIHASYPGHGDNSHGGKVVFDPGQYEERAALLLDRGVVYTSWASHCDHRPYTGWVIGYDAGSLQQVAVLDVTPNGNEGGIWASGAGPAADRAGHVYVLDGNGTFDRHLDANGFPRHHDFGNAFLKLTRHGHELSVSDYFAMDNVAEENHHDTDLGSGGAMLLPTVKGSDGADLLLAIGAGKDRNIYVVDRSHLGRYHLHRNAIHQELKQALDGPEFGAPAWFDHTLYYGAVGAPLVAFGMHGAKLSTQPASQTTRRFAFPGVTPSVSANGDRNGIVWVVENSDPAVLRAYAADDLSHELYDSNRARGGRDHFGKGNKFITPTIAGGHVYVGTPDGVAIFGLLHGRGGH